MTHPNTPDAPRDDAALDPNDPRLTAYALGELPDDERAAFEAELAGDPDARIEVEALRALGADLSTALAEEPAVALHREQREAIEAGVRRPARLGRMVGVAAAAAVLVGVFSLGQDHASREAPPHEVARDGYSMRVEGETPFLPAETTADVTTARAPGRVEGFTLLPDGKPAPIPPHYNEVTERVAVGTKPDGTVEYRDVVRRVAVRPASTRTLRGDEVSAEARGMEPAPKETPPPVGLVSLPPAGSPSTPLSGPPVTGNTKPSARHAQPTSKVPPVDLPAADGKAMDAYRETLREYELELGARGKDYVDAVRSYQYALRAGQKQAAQAAWKRVRELNPGALRVHFGRVGHPQQGGETFAPLIDNPFAEVKDRHTSTFSIDVDTASYANVRRMLLQEGRLPPADAVRIEEFINAFDYGYAKPGADAPHPLAMTGSVTSCPWNADHRLARIALQAHEVAGEQRPALNLVFLVDVSGSMRSAKKLPLVKRGLAMLLESLDEGDRVGIVTYASSASVRLESTVVSEATAIQNAIDGLSAGGSTNGAGGIQLAYQMARRHFVKGASNRVILATDGDFNVGITDDGDLETLIAKEAAAGVDLSVLGFGMGNYKDGRLERLSNRGNGNYAYIDTEAEARKALVDDMLGTLVTVAKDVKVQVFFNPATVRAWRLIGYANRQLAARDFNDDRKDAGEVGSGHAVTALYEIVPVGAPAPRKPVDPNPYVAPDGKEKPKADEAPSDPSDALFKLRLRYKKPGEAQSTLVETEIKDAGGTFDKSDDDFQWATAVAGFGLTLRDSQYAPGLSLGAVEEIAKAAAGDDPARKAFLEVVAKAHELRGR